MRSGWNQHILDSLNLYYGDTMQAKFEFTTRCNLECIHCSAASYRPAPEMETDLMMNMVENLLEEGYNEFHLQGGEPFIRPEIFDVLDLLEQHNAFFLVSTNSLLLNEEKIKKTLSYKGLITFTISLDGATREQHEALRGENTFDRTLNMIKLAAKWKAALNSKTKLTMNFCVTKINYQHIGEMFSLADKLGVDSVFILSLSLIGNAAHHKDELFLPEREELLALEKGVSALRKIDIARQAKGLKPLQVDFELFPYRWKCRLMKKARRFSSRPVHDNCASGISTIYVAADGTIYPCEGTRNFMDLLEKEVGPYERPNIRDCTVQEAKQTESFRRIVDYLHDDDRIYASVTPCSTCEHLRKCTLCPLFALADKEITKCTEEVMA